MPGTDEELEAAAGHLGRVGHRHDVVERQRVVVPLVDGDVEIVGREVEVPEMDRHRMW